MKAKHRRRSCAGKDRFDTCEKAAAYARRWTGCRFVYKCSCCRFYHLTSRQSRGADACIIFPRLSP